MQIWPAIDLRGGKCVRLRQGDYRQETVFGEDPAAMACRWVDAGARQLHLVDLEGARDGSLANRAAIAAILGAVQIPCQLGGGIRDEATIVDLFALGLQRLVIGTQALKRPAWFRDMCRKFPDRLVVGIDARDGRVATDGWLETSQVEATALAQGLAEEPIAGIVYTDIAKDGMMARPESEGDGRDGVRGGRSGHRVRGRDDGRGCPAAGIDGRGGMHYREIAVRRKPDIERRVGSGGTPVAARSTEVSAPGRVACRRPGWPAPRNTITTQHSRQGKQGIPAMAKANIQDIRNLVVCGHGGCGKTTLVDHLLTKTGAVNAHPSVDDGTSICDFDPEEKHHKYTIEAKVVHFEHGGKYFQVIDTPGYPDFIGQTIGAMHGVDTAAIVINAQSGIEVNTRRVFAEAGKAGLGRMIVINKMDAENIDFPALVDVIREMWGNACVLLNVPVGHGASFTGRGQHAQRARRHQRRADRSPRDPRSAAGVDHRSRRGGDGAIFRGHAADR